MEEATTFGADDYVPIVTNGTNKKALGQKIKDFIAGFFVNKSGDTMSGNLIVEKSNGEFVSKNPNVTINTSANNGVTSSQTEGVMVKDSANNDVTRFIAVQETNGDVIAQIAAFNKKTDGTATNNYINATIKKDGTRSYAIADPAAFRTAIGLTSSTTELTSPASQIFRQFIKNHYGVVYLYLDINSFTSTTAQTIGYLPDGYRPFHQILKEVIVISADDDSFKGYAHFTIRPTGEITLQMQGSYTHPFCTLDVVFPNSNN
jgi:hypothetical protein